MVATSHGLPLIVHLSESNVPALTRDDFIEELGCTLENPEFPYSQTAVSFFIEEIKLCQILRLTFTFPDKAFKLKLSTPRRSDQELGIIDDDGEHADAESYYNARHKECDRRLEEWYNNLPLEMQYDPDDIQKHQFWPAYLHLMFL